MHPVYVVHMDYVSVPTLVTAHLHILGHSVNIPSVSNVHPIIQRFAVETASVLDQIVATVRLDILDPIVNQQHVSV